MFPVSPEELQKLKGMMDEARAYWELQTALWSSASSDEWESREAAASEALREFEQAADAYFSALEDG